MHGLYYKSCIVTYLYRANGLTIRSRYANLSNSELDDRIRSYTQRNRMLGCNSILARLQADCIRVQRHRVRSSLHRVDPLGVSHDGVSRAIQRRRYSVRTPNSLWHIDGNHKLIRYEIINV